MASIERRLKRLGACLARAQGEGKGHPTPAGNKRRAHRHALDGLRPELHHKVIIPLAHVSGETSA